MDNPTSEVTQAIERLLLADPACGGRVTVDTIAAIAALITPAGRDELVLLRDEDADPYSFSGDENEDGRVISQHRFYRWGDDCIIAIGELNWQNIWDDETFDAKCAELTSALASTGVAGAGPFTVEDGANSHVFEQRIMHGEDCIAFADEPWASRIARALSEVPPVEGLTSGEGLLREALQRIQDEPDHILPIVTAQRLRNIAGFALLGERLP